MQYIVFDLEFNQDLTDKEAPKYFFEIIQIGALKLDEQLNTLAAFNRLIKPTVYKSISPLITELTGITGERLQAEHPFGEVYQDFIDFIGQDEFVFCVWGMTDIRELYKSAKYFGLDKKPLSSMYIDLQRHVARYFKLPNKRLPQLKATVEAMNIPTSYAFHDALYDAIYTAEIFKKLYHIPLPLEPKVYDPNFIAVRPQRQRKREVDYDRLIQQFEKMYARSMTEEEKGMIILAYKMGKTHQFLKEPPGTTDP